MEQESGTTQARALQLHGEQARSQAQLKLVENSMNREMQREKIRGDLLKEYVKGRQKASQK